MPILRQSIDDRAKQIERDLKDAYKQRIEAEKTLAEYQQQLDDAHQQAKLVMNQAHQQIIAEQKLLMKEFEKKIQCKKEEFKVELSYAKKQAVKDIRNMSVNIAILATAKLIAHKVTQEEAQEMVNKAIQEINATVASRPNIDT